MRPADVDRLRTRVEKGFVHDIDCEHRIDVTNAAKAPRLCVCHVRDATTALSILVLAAGGKP